MSEEEIKLFGKWNLNNIKILDPGLEKYINLKPVVLPHSGGRHEHRRFGKSKMNIIERLINNLMKPGRSGGKKSKALKIVKNALEIIHLKTGKNPIEILVRAIENAAPREDVTRLSYGGVVYYKAVDLSPQRRIDLALRYITDGAREASWKNRKTIEECLADEIIMAYQKDIKCYSLKKKYELERVALASR